jgi:hypothetical protein
MVCLQNLTGNFLLDSGLRFFINMMVLSTDMKMENVIKSLLFAHLYQDLMESLRIGKVQDIGLGIPLGWKLNSSESKLHTPSGPFTLAIPPSM